MPTPKSPISRVGGKYFLAGKIVPIFPSHTRYIEPFGGAMHVLFRKTRAAFEVYNDLDGCLVNFFRVVQSKPQELYDRLGFTLYSREWFDDIKHDLNSGTEVERAADFYMVNRQCFGGKMQQWGIDMTGCNKYFTFRQRLAEAHERLQGVYIEHRDFRWIIERYDSPDALFYCDPPYIFNGVRGKDKLYDHEMTDTDHAELVEILKHIKGRFVLSGYENALYDCFERVSLGEVAIHINGGRGSGVRPRKHEYIWMNF